MKGSKVHPSDESQNSATSADEQDDVSVKMNGTDSNSEKEEEDSSREMDDKVSVEPQPFKSGR